MRNRIISQFPIVLLTLVSIIQALALELMWEQITSADYLWELSLDAIVIWGMITVTLMGILQLWITYSMMVMGFTWQPGIGDSILPFVIGILEFLMINLIGSQFNPLWLYVLASLFVITNWVVHSSLRKARIEGKNESFFRDRDRATLKDFAGAIAIVLVCVIFGMLTTVFREQLWVALIAVVTMNIALVLQMYTSGRFWQAMMAVED